MTRAGRPELFAVPGAAPAKLEVRKLSFYYGKARALRDVEFDIPERKITAIIGPSGCGKSTLLRVFNRMYDLVPNARAVGSVMLDGEDVVTTRRLLELRQKVGMVFQRASPFPMSIRDNVAFAPRLLGWPQAQIKETVEGSLERAALLDEVKDRLHEPAASLSGGQQQRLAIARCIAVNPQVILMDEPCSALDPIATMRIDPQHAAGRTGLGLHRLHAHEQRGAIRRAHRVRAHRRPVQRAAGRAHRGLHHWTFRIDAAPHI